MKLPFFTKSKAAISAEVVNYKNPKNYPMEVLEIHHEFEIASDKLVKEAKQTLSEQPKVNEDKVNRLAKFGFRQVKEVEQGQQVLQKTAMSREQIELVNYYKQNYPFNKFITEEQVKEICHKYNLVCGDVDRFRGFVPDANLQDIERFSVKEIDLIFASIIDNRGNILANISRSDMTNEEWEVGRIESGNMFFVTSGNISNDIPDITNINRINKNLHHLVIDKPFCRVVSGASQNKFKICAPVKDMDISGLELTEGYKLTRKIEIPDPVVLQPVKGGYLIVTAWGDEASDPLVVNENFN